ncbi:S1C family serine protease [Methylibium rhizosphaerae]|uniref:S1C family serine protease n=1 Tax=Methylibium rhizosphaerae TaxID=2570323 RepID=UPI00112821BC|nr:trypsin-like peptidase domain-containing protein [Methylibium rhizosphaerae]
MRRTALYSRSHRVPPPQPAAPSAGSAQASAAVAPRPANMLARRPWLGWSLMFGLLAGLAAALWAVASQMPRSLTQQDIDAAVRHSLEAKPLPSKAAKAYQAIAPSVVRVVGYMGDETEAPPKPAAAKPRAGKAAPPAGGDGSPGKGGAPADPKVHRGVGTGVVIVDKGIILTNLHVVLGAKQIKVEFFNGMEADASVISVQPENDLAVLQASKVPDDMVAATLRSTSDLAPGDEVIAVGHPFGIGPSVSSGVVSGLKREFRSDEGQRVLTNLIQFDAAANPGNSGGPLVTNDGAVVGIVTAILNPSDQRTFIGIGFAVPIENAATAVGMPPF